MSRELMRINAPFRQPEWSALSLMEAPHLVQQVHAEFAAAGADVLTTNSYALVPFHIGEERFWNQAQELAALAGRLTRAAADEEHVNTERKVLVAGSLPPVFGSYRPDLFNGATVHKYLDVLVQGLSPYVDVWLGETLSSIEEAVAVQKAVKPTGKPFWISFTLSEDTNEKGTARLRSGQEVTEAARWALSSDAEALLFNCSQPEYMAAAVRDAKAVFVEQSVSLPIGVYANAFAQVAESSAANEEIGQTREDLDLESYAAFAHDWVANGATMVGGCCGIGCEHIRRLAREFSRRS